jgi:hypothetical protein
MALPSYVTFGPFRRTLLAPECQTLNREFFRRASTSNPICLLNFLGVGVSPVGIPWTSSGDASLPMFPGRSGRPKNFNFANSTLPDLLAKPLGNRWQK